MNVSQKDLNRINRVNQAAKRYTKNAMKKLGLDYFAANRIRSRARNTENRYFEQGYPDNDRKSALDFSQYGDAQVSRRTYMGLSNG